MRRSKALGAIVVVVALVVALVLWRSAEDPPPSAEQPVPAVVPDEATPLRDLRPAPGVVLTPRPRETDPCADPPADAPFTPVLARIDGVPGEVGVVGLPRDGAGTPGVPPLTAAGKHQLAWDAPGIPPGSPAGNTLVNAHTFPDGTALGNRLLATLVVGDRIALLGADGEQLCYRVTERLEAPLETAPAGRYYATDGPPQLALIVCSGTRHGPADWSHRTIWFATPIS